jgi:APA family basic amino acid/polyamine antiporter
MPELRRAIGLTQATAMVVGIIVGASIFVQPSEITHQVPSIPAILGVWLACGAMTLVGALVCAELSATFPRTGGVYVYLTEEFGRPLGFLWGWAMFWSMHTGIVAALGVVFARYVGYFTPLDDTGIKAVAIGIIALLSAVNYAGVQHGSRLQTLFTGGKLFAIVLIVVIGFTLGSRLPTHFVPAAQPPAPSFGGFIAAIVAGLFTFGGWHMVTYSAEETLNPQRTLPRALVAGVCIVTGAYVALNLVYLYVLPLDQVAASTRIAADAAQAVTGSGGGGIVSAIVLFSAAGSLTGVVLAGPRVYYAMAKDGLAFNWLGHVHPVYRTPHRAIVVQALWAAVLVATGTFRVLFTRVVYTEWLFFGLMAVGLVIVRRRAGLERP